MKHLKLFAILLICFCVVYSSCTHRDQTKITGEESSDSLISLTEDQARKIILLPVHCLELEYPNKLGQVLGSANDLKSPKALRPIFYGCFDWHSAVHGYWSIVELLKQYPNLDQDGAIRNKLNQHITPENMEVEIAFFNDPNNLNFERTYGWAWLFKLQESLQDWDDPDAIRWKSNLQPLVDLLTEKYISYLPKLVYPIRAGQHDNSAFSLSLSLDYARSVGNKAFEEAIVKHGKRLFIEDVNCDLSYEPSGYDFLSPCLEEAYFMSKILDTDAYNSWLRKFLPSLYTASFHLDPAIVKDRSDGKLVHLDGLNYSRAACLYGIAKAGGSDLNHLRQIAHNHLDYSIPNLSAKDDYMGSHWLGTFALYAIQHAQ